MDRGQSQLSQELQSRIRFLGAQLQPGPLLRERLPWEQEREPPTVDESLLLRFGGIGGIPNMLRAFDSWLSFLGTAEVPEPTPVTQPVRAVAPGTATGAADPTAMALLLVGATDPAAMALLAAAPATAGTSAYHSSRCLVGFFISTCFANSRNAWINYKR